MKYGYQINKPKSFNQSILKNLVSDINANAQFDKPSISFKQWILLKPIKYLRWCVLGCLIGSWYTTKPAMYLPLHLKLNFQNLFDYD